MGTAGCRTYPRKADCTRNSLGCGLASRNSAANSLSGEVSAAYFFAAGSDSILAIHAVLKAVSGSADADDFTARLGANKLGERLFLVANPKWARKVAEDAVEAVEWIKGSDGKTVVELRNHVERIFPGTRVLHNTPGQTVLANIGGIKPLLPLLFRLSSGSDHKFVYLFFGALLCRNTVAATLLSIQVTYIRNTPSHARAFLQNADGMTVWRYLLEKASSLLI